MPVKLFFGVHVSVHLAVDVGVHLADIYIGSAVGGVGVGGCAVRVRLRCMHGHVIFQHSTAGHVTVPVSTGGH